MVHAMMTCRSARREDQLRRLSGDHLRRGIGRPGDDAGHDGCVGDPEVLMTASLNQTIQFLALLRRGTEAAEPGPPRQQLQLLVEMFEPVAAELDGQLAKAEEARPFPVLVSTFLPGGQSTLE